MKLAPGQDPWAAPFFDRPPDPLFREQITDELRRRAQVAGVDVVVLGLTGEQGYWCEWRLARRGDDWLFSLDSHHGQSKWAPRDAARALELRRRLRDAARRTPPDALGCVTSPSPQGGSLFVYYESERVLIFRGFEELREPFVDLCSLGGRAQHAARVRGMRVRMGLCEECGEPLGWLRKVVLRARSCAACSRSPDAS